MSAGVRVPAVPAARSAASGRSRCFLRERRRIRARRLAQAAAPATVVVIARVETATPPSPGPSTFGGGGWSSSPPGRSVGSPSSAGRDSPPVSAMGVSCAVHLSKSAWLTSGRSDCLLRSRPVSRSGGTSSRNRRPAAAGPPGRARSVSRPRRRGRRRRPRRPTRGDGRPTDATPDPPRRHEEHDRHRDRAHRGGLPGQGRDGEGRRPELRARQRRPAVPRRLGPTASATGAARADPAVPSPARLSVERLFAQGGSDEHEGPAIRIRERSGGRVHRRGAGAATGGSPAARGLHRTDVDNRGRPVDRAAHAGRAAGSAGRLVEHERDAFRTAAGPGRESRPPARAGIPCTATTRSSSLPGTSSW